MGWMFLIVVRYILEPHASVGERHGLELGSTILSPPTDYYPNYFSLNITQAKISAEVSCTDLSSFPSATRLSIC